MKSAFDEWEETYELYLSGSLYAEDAFYGGMQYAINLINASMPPEISAAILETVREKLSEGTK